jgi:hypothetical protein
MFGYEVPHSNKKSQNCIETIKQRDLKIDGFYKLEKHIKYEKETKLINFLNRILF